MVSSLDASSAALKKPEGLDSVAPKPNNLFHAL
jgi:hypothetical protein